MQKMIGSAGHTFDLLYADVDLTDGLASAITLALLKQFGPVADSVTRDLVYPVRSITWCGLVAGERRCEISLGVNQRAFVARFGLHGFGAANYRTDSFESLTDCVGGWLLRQVSTSTLRAGDPAITLLPCAEALERGRAEYVDCFWTRMEQRLLAEPALQPFAAVVEAAAADPLGRTLFPGFSHERFFLSATPTPDAALFVGAVAGEPRRYKLFDSSGEVIVDGDAKEIVDRMIAGRTPAG